MKLTKYLVFLIGVSLAGAMLLGGVTAEPEAPVQPVAFDHWQHVAKESGPQLECSFCHEHADKSRYATVPNINTCMGCHESMMTDSPEVKKLAAFAEKSEQPPWARVYWFEESASVFFTHKAHIRAGIDCANCHGQVTAIADQIASGDQQKGLPVRREIDQTMGWCINCHKERKVSVDCYVCHR
jgi:hypothetical protein